MNRNAPDVPAAERAQALVNLRTLPGTDVNRVTAALGPGAPDVVRFLARPDVGAAIRAPDPFFNGERLAEMASNRDAFNRATALSPRDLQAWWAARPEAGMTVEAFFTHLRAIETFRGSLTLQDPTQARTVAAAYAQASDVRTLIPNAPYSGPSIGLPPTAGTTTRTATNLRDQISHHLAAEGFAGETLNEFRVGGTTYVVRFQNGEPAQAWRFQETPAFSATRLPLEAQLASVRGAVERAEQIATMDRVRAREALGTVSPTVQALDFLRFTRSAELRATRDVLERAQPTRFDAAPPGPVMFGPETWSNELRARKEAIVERAARLGVPETPGAAQTPTMVDAVNAVNAIKARRPGAASDPTTLAAIETQANAAEAALQRVSTEALNRVRDRVGAAALSNARSGPLAGLTDAQVGDVLAATRGLQGIGADQIRGLLHAAYPPPGTAPVSVQRVLERAPTAAERNRLLDNFARVVEAGIPGAHAVLASMVGSRTSWRGGMFTFDFLRYRGGASDVLGLEVREAAPDPQRPGEAVRVYDIVLRSGRRIIEMKDWSNWFEETIRRRDPTSRRSQFERELLLRTNNLANPEAIAELHWVFKGPGPAIAGTSNPMQVYAHIRATMRSALRPSPPNWRWRLRSATGRSPRSTLAPTSSASWRSDRTILPNRCGGSPPIPNR